MDDFSRCFQKGLAYKEMGLVREAVNEFQKALSDDILKYKAGRQIAGCLVQMGQFEEAERVLVQILLALEIPREDRLKAALDLADLYLAVGRTESALERLVQVFHESFDFSPGLREKIHELRSKLGVSNPCEAADHGFAAAIIAAAHQAEIAYTTTMESRFSQYVAQLSSQPRVNISNPVEYSFDQTNWSTGYYTYVSLSGMFIITYSAIPVGCLVFLRFALPDESIQEPLEIIGQAIREESGDSGPDSVLGMEVRFIKIADNDERVLRAFIERQHTEEEEAAQEIEKIRFLCDNCGRIVSVDLIGCGKRVLCLCGESVQVPYSDHTPTRKNPLRGLQLAGCRIDEVIGEGATAIVYKAHHLVLDIPVAVKVFHNIQQQSGNEMTDRFLTEARVVARINHPNVVAIMNAGEERGCYFIVMQYVRGGSLFDLLKQRVEFCLTDFIRVFVDLCSALSAAHQQTVVHGDLKPANILITHSGKAMLGDFGLVRVLRKYRGEDPNKVVKGTPMYMSPEQARGGTNVDVRSDIYSLGATMYHVLTGQPPFEGLTYRDVIRKHLDEEPVAPSLLNHAIPPPLSSLIMRTLRKDPRERLRSAEDVRRKLIHLAAKQGIREIKPVSKDLLIALRRQSR